MNHVKIIVNKEALIEELYTHAAELTESHGFKSPDKENFFEYYMGKFESLEDMLESGSVDSILSYFVDVSVIDMMNGKLPFRLDEEGQHGNVTNDMAQ